MTVLIEAISFLSLSRLPRKRVLLAPATFLAKPGSIQGKDGERVRHFLSKLELFSLVFCVVSSFLEYFRHIKKLQNLSPCT